MSRADGDEEADIVERLTIKDREWAMRKMEQGLIIQSSKRKWLFKLGGENEVLFSSRLSFHEWEFWGRKDSWLRFKNRTSADRFEVVDVPVAE